MNLSSVKNNVSRCSHICKTHVKWTHIHSTIIIIEDINFKLDVGTNFEIISSKWACSQIMQCIQKIDWGVLTIHQLRPNRKCLQVIFHVVSCSRVTTSANNLWKDLPPIKLSTFSTLKCNQRIYMHDTYITFYWASAIG